MNQTRSPIKDAPLRNPAQSVEEEALDFAMGRIFAPCMVALVMALIAALEWLRYYMAVPPHPWLYTVIALAVASYAGLRTWRAWPRLRQLRQAADGERTVGQFLERLRERGYYVFHDLVGDGFNVDHVVVGPTGVFSVETKTFSKPVRGEAKIHFDGQTILINGITPDRDPVVQAKAQAAWVRELISESAGKKFPVRPVVLFPGWFIEQSKTSTSELWVLNPKALPDFLEHAPAVLSEADVKLASFHLSRFIRSVVRAQRMQ